MIRTIIVLLVTLICIPLAAWYFGTPLNDLQIHMIKTSFGMMSIAAVSCFIVSELTRNCSQVDKLWSTIPLLYTWYFAWASDWNSRLVLMAVLVTLWGIRLTYNFSRRGGYNIIPWKGHEDYRWEVLRQNPALKGRWRWALFNFFFISFYQQTLILLFCLPAVMASVGTQIPLGIYDYVLAFLFVAFLLIETIADQQQYNYQQEKWRRIHAGEAIDGEYATGFIRTGLWRWARHPNYACEQTIWLIFYFFSVVGSGEWFNWSLAGIVLLMMLFQGSANFSEEISAGKYPLYTDYIKKTGRFLPKLF
ncbi:MAG: DUF1295 domain-containing protein [Chitinophagaceae bacterium]|nr:DUF1295 domain-containing protein [Chitinophagaceae bacterium]